jgi:DNA polymerase III subunit gamma/tau
MAYEVTATRRRPQRFEDMIGQEFVVATLQKSVAAGKIAHAYLFSGPRGCGKTSSARILAKALNCDSGPGATPCGTCPACVEITRGSSLDVIEIDGASNTSVNDVRQIKDEVRFPPNSCRYKIYIIDEVHMLSTSAFNALLKTIEEPPPYVIFIFATTELHKVPATIKSRCQQFNFRLVPVELLKQVLAEAAGETGIKADEEALFWIAREATGSVRDAYTLYDQVAAFSDGHITFDKIRDKLGLVGVDRINPLVEACARKDARAALEALDVILEAGVSVEQFTVDAADYFRSLLLVRTGITKEALLGQSPERFSAMVLEAWAPVQIERALSVMLQLYRDIRYSLDPRYELELAVSRLSWISDYVSTAQMKQAIQQAKNLLEKGSAGPLADAGPTERVQAPDAVRKTDEGPVRETVIDEDGREAGLGEAMAALKARFGGGAPATRPQTKPVAMEPPLPSVEAPVISVEPHVVPVAIPVIPVEPEPLPAASPEVEASPIPASVSLVSDLQAPVVAFFQSSKNMLATGLSQTYGWKESGTKVVCAVAKPFVHTLLVQEHAAITSAISHLLGRPVGFEVRLETAVSLGAGGAGDTEMPVQVEKIRQMFRGTIL